MQLTYVPLLAEQRDLYRRPRDMKRFKAYLYLTIDFESLSARRPTLAMNLMARDHVAHFLDALIALGAEQVGEAAMREADLALKASPGAYQVALVVCDDIGGGWTNRFACEYAERLAGPPPTRPTSYDWIVGTLWVSETPTPNLVREQVLTALYRQAYVREHGQAETLGDLLRQEGRVMARSGCTKPMLDPDDLEYTRAVLEPLLVESDMRTAIQALFGDEAGATLGFPPLGLTNHAGLALALHDARADDGRRAIEAVSHSSFP